MASVPEGSTAYLTVSFYDKTGTAMTPTTASWQAHDVRSGNLLQAETSLTPGTSVEITIPASVNELVSQEYAEEQRRITIAATYGSGGVINDEYVYSVRNLKAVS